MFWEESNLSDDQAKRMGNARCLSVKTIDTQLKHGLINNYEVTLEGCSCRDFAVRRSPCKHMYRLAHELGLLILDGPIIPALSDDPAAISRDKAKNTVRTLLNREERILLQQILSSCAFGHTFLLPKQNDSLVTKLFDCGILENRFDVDILFHYYTKNEIMDMAMEHSISIDKILSKAKVVKFLKENYGTILNEIFPQMYIINVSERFTPHARSIYGMLCSEFGPWREVIEW